ncbi:MAG: LacI family DNA-binding transcriptional regulator [Lacisediminihabitans sp.]
MDSARSSVTPAPAVVTLQHVADRAGVARATASLALNGKGRMTEETRERVRSVAEKLGYAANPTARNLRAARSGSIGLYVPDHTLSFRYYMDVAFGAVERAQEADLLVTLMPVVVTPHSSFLDHLDGFIMIDPFDEDPMVRRLLEGRRPVVSGERAPVDMPAPFATVYSDHVAGIRLLLDHLWDQGSRSPTAILPGSSLEWGRQMRRGYEQWCAEKGIEARFLVAPFQMSAAELRDSCDKLLTAPGGMDAIITSTEGTAVIARDAIRSAGMVIGRDILLASYVDSDPLSMTEPSITALNLRPREFGRQCVTLLLDGISDAAESGRSIEVAVSLVARQSSQWLSPSQPDSARR